MECLAKTMVDQTLDTIRSDRDTAYEGIGDVTDWRRAGSRD